MTFSQSVLTQPPVARQPQSALGRQFGSVPVASQVITAPIYCGNAAQICPGATIDQNSSFAQVDVAFYDTQADALAATNRITTVTYYMGGQQVVTTAVPCIGSWFTVAIRNFAGFLASWVVRPFSVPAGVSAMQLIGAANYGGLHAAVPAGTATTDVFSGVIAPGPWEVTVGTAGPAGIRFQLQQQLSNGAWSGVADWITTAISDTRIAYLLAGQTRLVLVNTTGGPLDIGWGCIPAFSA